MARFSIGSYGKYALVGLLLLVLGPGRARAQQDSPLSTNFDLPLLMNPARSGLSGEKVHDEASKHFFNLNYKNQLRGCFSSTAIRMLSASYSALLLDRTMSAGLDVYTNTLNNAVVSDFSIHANYAYHWLIGTSSENGDLHRLSFGLQAGLRNWGVDLDDIKTGGMYDPAYSGGFNPALVPSYEFDDLSRTVFDLQVGIHYTGWVQPNLCVESGLSAYHLNRGRAGLGDVSDRMDIKFLVYGGLSWHDKAMPESVSEDGHYQVDAALMAHEVGGTVTYMNQGVYHVLEFAAMYRLYLCAGLSVGAGLAYRTLCQAHVFSPLFALDISRFQLNLQFDINAGVGKGYTNLMSIGLAYRF